MRESLSVEKRGAIWLVRFHNPERSYMDQHTSQALSDLLDEIESDTDVRVVVMTGSEPGVFIRHYDVRVLHEMGKELAAQGVSFSLDKPVPGDILHATLRRMEQLPIPFIAAVNGTAMGGGLEMALACDVRLFLAGDYEIGFPEVRVGLLPGAGGTQRLARLIGASRALQMNLTGNIITPQQALDYGIALQLVEEDVLPAALALAERMAGYSPRAMAHIKFLGRGAMDWTLDEGLSKEQTLFCDLLVSEEGIAEMGRMIAGELNIQDA